MLTKKKRVDACCWVAVAASFVLLTACSRSGSEALLNGVRLLDRGQAGAAVRELREAVSLMPTNAIAWGYLGLAYHQEGSTSNAVHAYTRALTLSPDLGEVHFNLGCLWMEQQQWADAREHFAAATALNKQSAQAWRCLGETQWRMGETDQAVQSFG